MTAFYTALSLACWRHLVVAGVSTHIHSADVGDVGQRVWFMAWLPFAIGHHLNPLTSNYMFAPHGINVLANSSVLLEAFLFAPITELSSPVTSVNLACIAAPVVSSLSLYYVLRHYDMRRSVAIVGGLIYGFSPAVLQSNGLADFNLTWAFFPPLAAYLIDRMYFRRTGSPVRLGLAMGLLVVVQFFSGLELLLDVAVVAAPIVLLVILANLRLVVSHLRFAAQASATALVTIGVALAYPMTVYLTGPGHIGAIASTAAPGAAVTSPVWPSAPTGDGYLDMPPNTPWQHLFDNAFVGPAIVVLALAALLFVRRHRIVLVLWAGALWSMLLSWGGATRLSGGSAVYAWHGPAWYLSAAIPVLKNVGWLRISTVTDCLLALLVAITLERTAAAAAARWPAWRGHRGTAALGLAGVVMVVPLLIGSNVPYVGFERVSVPDVLRDAPTGGQRPATILVFPIGGPSGSLPLAWQAVAGFPYRSFEGYAWHPLPGNSIATAEADPSLPDYLLSAAPHASRSVSLEPEQCAELVAAFEHADIRAAVVLPGYPGSEQVTRIYDQVFGPGRTSGNAQVWLTGGSGRSDGPTAPSRSCATQGVS